MKATPGTLLHVCRKCQSAIEHNTKTGDFIVDAAYFNVNISQSNCMDVELGQLLRRTQANRLSLIHVYLETVEHP